MSRRGFRCKPSSLNRHQMAQLSFFDGSWPDLSNHAARSRLSADCCPQVISFSPAHDPASGHGHGHGHDHNHSHTSSLSLARARTAHGRTSIGELLQVRTRSWEPKPKVDGWWRVTVTAGSVALQGSSLTAVRLRIHLVHCL